VVFIPSTGCCNGTVRDLATVHAQGTVQLTDNSPSISVDNWDTFLVPVSWVALVRCVTDTLDYTVVALGVTLSFRVTDVTYRVKDCQYSGVTGLSSIIRYFDVELYWQSRNLSSFLDFNWHLTADFSEVHDLAMFCHP
jgi:hypothetical protein